MSSSSKLVFAILMFVLISPQSRTATTQNDTVQPNCIITVPSGWGNFKAASALGLVFEDSAGTLRVVGSTPCQISGTVSPPVVTLEVRRK